MTAPPTAPTDEPGRSDPVADPLYPRFGNPDLDVLSYQLALGWTPTTRSLSGRATLRIRAVRAASTLTLDFADSYRLDGVQVDGLTAPADQRDDDLRVTAAVTADQVVTLVVAYHGRPESVPMPSGRGDFTEGLGLRAAADGEAWTMQEPYGGFTWYPVNDQPSDEAIYDIAVTVPTGWAAVANGALTSTQQDGSHVTYRWQSDAPVASYLATLAVGRYTKLTDTGPRGLPITYWLRTGRDEAFAPAVRDTPELLAWLEERFGPYPFDSAGVVLVDSASAMETQQMVTYGARLSRATGSGPDLDLVREILLHEYAHQWFGNAVTPTDWTGLWLNEGLAMYAEWLWTVDQGWQTDADWVARARRVDANTRPEAGPPGHPKPDHFGESNVYLGPALMLHLIRQRVGDKAFFAMARDWVQTQKHEQVDRAAFIAFANRHTGVDLTNLISEWLDSPTTPR